jgi:hypothetical protein
MGREGSFPFSQKCAVYPFPEPHKIQFMPSHPVSLRFILYDVMLVTEVRYTYTVIRTLREKIT